jgi:DNA-binding transcriptional MerR regulator
VDRFGRDGAGPAPDGTAPDGTAVPGGTAAPGGTAPDGTGPARDRGVYGISVAAELVGTGVQNLRLYEARGLLEPARTGGGTRRYSPNDLDRLRRIGDLLAAGLNLAGIAMVLDLEQQNARLRTERSGMGGEERQATEGGIDPAAAVPEADLLEQRADLDVPDAPAPVTIADRLVDEADLLDQATPVGGDEDDDFPHD